MKVKILEVHADRVIVEVVTGPRTGQRFPFPLAPNTVNPATQVLLGTPVGDITGEVEL